ncbi:lipase family protein [Ramlibacter sp. MMS24-I3-19]|uniref:lipase family protein n=1 Tax=Ramlibacter sp. MMS24-I3-19 TaxID=3416606 RepID=UPI003D07CF04
MQRRWMLSSLAAAALLVACGGNSNDDVIVGRGTLVDTPAVVTTLTAAQIDAQATSSGLEPLAGPAQCDVKVVSLNYRTPGALGEDSNASGVLLVPAGACASASAPLLAYARGTEVSKPRTLASATDPETFSLAAMFAAQGYAVVATDYLGFAKSSYPFHPYLHADSEASSVVDSIRAARFAAPGQGLALSGKVMVTGYSQGGHSSAATQRAIERDNKAEINLVGAAHLAAPVNLSGSFKLPNAIAGYQFFVPFIVTAWQKIYGNIYTSPTQVFKQPYAATIETLLPSPTLTYSTLITTGALPGGTPNQARDALFQSAFLTDVQTNPNNGLYQDAVKNDLTGFTPKARTLLCGGSGDPTVPPAVHQNVWKAALDAKGATNVTTVDVDPSIQAAFGPGGVAPTDPTTPAYATYYGSYHGGYEPPFCYAQARALFNTLR